MELVLGRWEGITLQPKQRPLLCFSCPALAPLPPLSFRAVVLEAAAWGGVLTAITVTTCIGLSLWQVQLPAPEGD